MAGPSAQWLEPTGGVWSVHRRPPPRRPAPSCPFPGPPPRSVLGPSVRINSGPALLLSERAGAGGGVPASDQESHFCGGSPVPCSRAQWGSFPRPNVDLPPAVVSGVGGSRQPCLLAGNGSGACEQLPAQRHVGASGCGDGDTGGPGARGPEHPAAAGGLPAWPRPAPPACVVWEGAGWGRAACWLGSWAAGGGRVRPGEGRSWARTDVDPVGGCRTDRPRGNLAGTGGRVPGRSRGRA